MYKLYLFKTDGHKAEYEYKSKPTFDDMYSKIGCSMIEMSTAKMPEYSNRKDGYTDIYFDEEFLLKGLPVVNTIVTDAWYKWQRKTGHMSLPGTTICGNVAIIQKIKDEAA